MTVSTETLPITDVLPERLIDGHDTITISPETGILDGVPFESDGIGPNSRTRINYDLLVDKILESLRHVNCDQDTINHNFDKTMVATLVRYCQFFPTEGVTLTANDLGWYPPWLELFDRVQNDYDILYSKIGDSVPVRRPLVEIQVNDTIMWSGLPDFDTNEHI